MVRRYIASSGNKTKMETDKLRDQFIKELTQEGQSVIKTLLRQFTQDLQSQGDSGGGGGESSGAGGDGTSLITSGQFKSIFGSVTKSIFKQSRSKISTFESSRSLEMEQRFKVSQAQALAETAALMSKGNKNS